MQECRIQCTDYRHRARKALMCDQPNTFDAIHAGHIQVHQHHIGQGALLTQHVQCMQAIGTLQRAFNSQLIEQAQGDAALKAVVFHHHHLQFRPAHATSPKHVASGKPTPAGGRMGDSQWIGSCMGQYGPLHSWRNGQRSRS